MLHRRGLITGLVSLVAAPAIVRVGSLMPVRGLVLPSAYGQIYSNRYLRTLLPAETWREIIHLCWQANKVLEDMPFNEAN